MPVQLHEPTRQHLSDRHLSGGLEDGAARQESRARILLAQCAPRDCG